MNSFSWKAIWNKTKKMKRTDWLIVLLTGILILIVAIPTGTKKDAAQSAQGEDSDEADKASASADSRTGVASRDTYRSGLEEELEELLRNMSGVGNVKVMITLKNDGEDVLNKDISSENDSYKESTVVYQKENGDAPYITSQLAPQVAGVVVVAEGGGNPVTATDISDAVMALFGIDAHKIKIVKMSVQEGTQ